MKLEAIKSLASFEKVKWNTRELERDEESQKFD